MRPYDLIVWGVTGFTGKLVAEYLCHHYMGVDAEMPQTGSKRLHWAIAGRSLEKCQQVLDDLKVSTPFDGEIDILTADALDLESLQILASQCRVMCTTVGPYRKYGRLLLQACVEQGTHYVDLTGESPFVRESIDLYHQEAHRQKLKIVHACGFDSIPSDLGVFFTQQQMLQQKGHYASQIRMMTGKMKGGLSGGTFASMVDLFEEARNDRAILKLLGNPYALNPLDAQKGLDRHDQMGVQWDRWAGKWTCPFMMAGVNTRVVRRSHALQGFPYGSHFRYSEVMGWPEGLKGLMTSIGITVGLGGFVGLMASSKWLRNWIHRRFLPQPGEGPSAQSRQEGYFTIHFYAGDDKLELACQVSDNIDPGYACTAKMMAESALSLVFQMDDLPQDFGVLTPSVAFGTVLLERLEAKGMLFSVN